MVQKNEHRRPVVVQLIRLPTEGAQIILHLPEVGQQQLRRQEVDQRQLHLPAEVRRLLPLPEAGEAQQAAQLVYQDPGRQMQYGQTQNSITHIPELCFMNMISPL